MHALLDWLGHLPPALTVLVGSMLPIIELRGTIPYGLLATSLPDWLVILLASVGTWIVGPLIYLLMAPCLRLLARWRWFGRLWARYTAHAQHKIHAAVERKGSLGLVVFIAIPLPGFGIYTGAVGAYLLGMSLPRFLWVSAAGVLLSAAIVAAAAYSGSSAFAWMLGHKIG